MLSKTCNHMKEKILLRIRYYRRFRPWKKNGKWVMAPVYKQLQYDAVNIDINNTCNLRCRFCFNVFEPEHFYMTKELFSKILPIFSMTKDVGDDGTGVYLSCLYEPSLSPYFLEILEMLPVEARKKAFFTTNLCRPWDLEKMKKMLTTNLHHINISIETLRQDRHEEISSSRHFPVFRNNLNTLAALYPTIKGYKPKLRFITMILKINQDEILDIVRFCSEKLYSSQHELRTPYISTYENMVWNREQLLEPGACRQMEKDLKKSGFPVITDIHSKEELVSEEPGENKQEENKPEEKKTEESKGKENKRSQWEKQMDELMVCMHPEYLFARFHPSGTCTLNVTKEVFSIVETDDPETCYRDNLRMLCQRRAKAFWWREGFASAYPQPISMRIMIEELEATEAGLMVRGWGRAGRREAEGNLFMAAVEDEEGSKKDFLTLPVSRPDLEREDGQTLGFGFALYVGRHMVSSGNLKLEFSFVQKDTFEKLYRYEYPYCIRWH